MSSEAFEHYLSDDSRRGPAPDGAFSGAAGGAPCGDLVRLSLAVTDGRVAAASFDAEGCAATVAAAVGGGRFGRRRERAVGGEDRPRGSLRRAGGAVAPGSPRGGPGG